MCVVKSDKKCLKTALLSSQIVWPLKTGNLPINTAVEA